MVIVGDALEKLKELPPGSAHCCVTSPPYWGLRDYGVEGQLGLESSPEAFVKCMVAVFREVHRVLRNDGTLWLNIGDGYASSGGAGWQGKHGARASRTHTQRRRLGSTVGNGLKTKDLIGMPWRLAFALQADGWYLRQNIIWHKPNPMPESVRDRCTKAHEDIFLLSKRPRYYFDAEAIKEKCSPNTHARMARAKPEHAESDSAHGGDQRRGRSMGPRVAGVNPKASAALMSGPRSRQNASFAAATAGVVDRRNKRSVWTVGSQPFSGAHFATFPPKLIEPCILAGCPLGGVVLDPFFGAGTTGLVATKLGRDFIGIELNHSYAAMAEARIRGTQVDFSAAQGRG